MSVIKVRSWWIGHRGFSLRPKLSIHSFIHMTSRVMWLQSSKGSQLAKWNAVT